MHSLRLIQYNQGQGSRVAVVSGDGRQASPVHGVATTYELASQAIRARRTLAHQIEELGLAAAVDYPALLAEGRVLPPLHHPDPAHCYVTGTGLTHLGSAAARDKMHQKLGGEEEQLTDSMRMFKWGLGGGKSEPGLPGVQPEWFYKGDGSIVTAPGAALPSPDFALDGGEEPELVGLYLIGPDGHPWRLGYALGNEFSDHVTERQNYLYLAHSKLRPCAVGPELRVGNLPRHLEGHSRIYRGDTVRWEKPFLTGEDNMCHDFANLEFHHFKYQQFLRPGDVHLHFFGTATLSFADGVRVEEGDVFEVALPEFGAPLRNPLGRARNHYAVGSMGVL
ncbi:AraD1 family protein [Chitinimonas sp.]|uniref:AraD1 family protein n=1 Tax=Chitinimonas sp. TaxID=1934313 RepID=UPI002F92DC71